ncbi:hypothetical protein [Agreia sp. COWG]|uniref:hypothetical protein n=1 Tax=Agreia sp. COWG TaxID=2773266 RepID=UPI0019287436|nr:hypothetical protein [Agreia sp. COWG]CAD6001464.1 conserved protein of unknown function [Agreia sp. COWG]
MTIDAPTPENDKPAETPDPAETRAPDPAQSTAVVEELFSDEAGTTTPPAPLVLTGRDRFVVKLIDAAVKIGSDDFQQRYRPVTDEFFSHHVIDPTAKPAYVQPDLDPVVDLETTEDPLEIIRLHLDSVIEDRQARDNARISAEQHVAEVSAQLAESRALAADLRSQLDTQTARADAGEAEAARLRTELQNQVAALTAQLENEVAAIQQQRDADVAALQQQRETEVAALVKQQQLDISGLQAQREAEVATLSAERDSQVQTLHQQRENELATLRSERDATIAGLHAQRETQVAALTAELAELRAARDAQIGELEARLEAQLAELEGNRSSEASALAADHETELVAIRTTHEQAVSDLAEAHQKQVADLEASHERHIAELVSEKAALSSAMRGESANVDESLAAAEAQIAELREERDLSNAQRDAAVEELDGAVAQRGEWENRLRLTVAALAGSHDVGEWTEHNAPEQRLVEFVQSTTRSHEQKLARIEQLATEELVDETETNEYAIGANDAAVRVLNALDGADEE